MNSGKKYKAIAAILLGLTIAGCGGGGGDDDSNDNGSASTPQSGTASTAGAEYLTQTYQTGQAQAQQSQAAEQKATDPAVRELAQQVNNEITIINQQITNISQSVKVTINKNLTSEQTNQLNNLNSLSGAEFDRAYLRNLVSSMRSLLTSTLRQARQGTDVQIRQTAAANVLLIQQRLAIAQEVWFTVEPPQYLAGAFEDSLLEVELAKLALEKATGEQVKQFAQMMVDEHTELNAQLTALASQKTVTFPTTLGPDKQEIVTAVSAYSGADFDKAYIDSNVLLHAADIAKTSLVSEQSSDAEIRAFAAQTLPLLQEHYQQAQTIAAAIQPSALYQLGQSLIAELQLAQLAQVRADDEQGRALAQNIARRNQASFAELVRLIRSESAQLPLTIPPGQVEAALQLLRGTGTSAQQIESLISLQLRQALQIAQAFLTDSEAAVSSLAKARLEILQNLSTNGGEDTGAGTGTSGGSADDAGTVGGGTSSGDDASGSGGAADGGGTSGTESPSGTEESGSTSDNNTSVVVSS